MAAKKVVLEKSTRDLYLVKNAPKVLPKNTELARFAAGCFWGVEDYFRQEPGVIATAVGFSGGNVPNPTYKEVCTGDTGHAESVEIEFDPTKTSYEKLVKLFFEIHDPTELNRQGPDVGDQYRSVIFVRTPEQRRVATDVMAALQATSDFKNEKIVTEIVPAESFYFAEDYHQQYIEHGGRAFCHARTHRDFGKPPAQSLLKPKVVNVSLRVGELKVAPPRVSCPAGANLDGPKPQYCEATKLLLSPGGPHRVVED